MSRLMAFIDGENLTIRYEAMLAAGCVPRNVRQGIWDPAAPIHESNIFVWSPSTLSGLLPDEEVLRAQYYTTFCGADDELEKFTQRLAQQQTDPYLSSGTFRPTVRLIPKVFKKAKRSTKTKSVDINICVDILDYVSNNALDSVFLVTGDVDYLPLIKSVMSAGKRVYVAALSDGLSNYLTYATDYFQSLDNVYFSSVATK